MGTYVKKTDKVYIRLRGDEVAHPDDEKRARAFMQWYADNMGVIRDDLIYEHLYDDEVATDSALAIYDAIAYKGLNVKNYKWYYLRAYHTTNLMRKKRTAHELKTMLPMHVNTTGYDDAGNLVRGTNDTLQIILAEPPVDYTEAIAQINTEVLDYVRGQFDREACILFEMYLALWPAVSYKGMAQMLGYRVHHIEPLICEIKKDVVRTFGRKKDFLLSMG